MLTMQFKTTKEFNPQKTTKPKIQTNQEKKKKEGILIGLDIHTHTHIYI